VPALRPGKTKLARRRAGIHQNSWITTTSGIIKLAVGGEPTGGRVGAYGVMYKRDPQSNAVPVA